MCSLSFCHQIEQLYFQDSRSIALGRWEVRARLKGKKRGMSSQSLDAKGYLVPGKTDSVQPTPPFSYMVEPFRSRESGMVA